MKFLKLTICVLFVGLFNACTKENDTIVEPPPATVVNFTSTINGESEVPSNASTANGSATAKFDKITKILSLTMTYGGLTATNMHIHKAPVGVSGGVLFGIGGPAPYSYTINYTSPALSVGQEDSLMNNQFYLNIHTRAFPGGEIRGQMIKQK